MNMLNQADPEILWT